MAMSWKQVEKAIGLKKIDKAATKGFNQVKDQLSNWRAPTLRTADITDAVTSVTDYVQSKSDELDPETKFYSLLLPPVLVFNYFFGRYFGPLTAFLCRLKGQALYVYANFKYEPGVVKFDDTILTYGTDYLIAGFMAYVAWQVFETRSSRTSKELVPLAVALLFTYGLSTFVGALCHNFLSDIDSMNTALFRMLWRVCVGSVGFSGGLLGALASNFASLPVSNPDTLLFRLPVVPMFFWATWSVFHLIVICLGLYSMTTPACDIFLAGVTQTIPHAYFMAAAIQHDERHFKRYKISNKTRNILLFGLFLNIPLLPGYDLMSFLSLPLGITNCIMHTNLAVAWGSQGYALYKISKGIGASE